MTTKLEVMRDLSASLGHIREIEQVPAGYDCPVHEIPLVENHVDTISGWQAVIICPAHDGTCSYDPDGEPMQIESPEGKEKDTENKPAKPANQGGF